MGLGHRWEKLLNVLVEISDIYESANKTMTAFLLNNMRSLIPHILRNHSGILLDIGSGPGTMIERILRNNDKLSLYIALDPLSIMLRKIESFHDSRIERVMGVFEFIPFRENSIDISLAIFSFRDAINYVRAMQNVFNVLKRDGIFVVMDLYKGDNKLGTALRKLYFSAIPRITGLMLKGIRGLYLYSWLGHTFDTFLSESQIRVLSKKVGFRAIVLRQLLRMAMIVVMIK